MLHFIFSIQVAKIRKNYEVIRKKVKKIFHYCSRWFITI